MHYSHAMLGELLSERPLWEWGVSETRKRRELPSRYADPVMRPAQPASLRTVLLSASPPIPASITSDVHLRLSRRIARCCAERLGGSCGARCGVVTTSLAWTGGTHRTRLSLRIRADRCAQSAELECAVLSGSPPCLAARRTSDKIRGQIGDPHFLACRLAVSRALLIFSLAPVACAENKPQKYGP